MSNTNPRIENKKEILENVREFHLKIINIIDDINAGMSEIDACRKHGISHLVFRNNTIYRKTLNGDLSQSEITNLFKEPYHRIYEDVFHTTLTSQTIQQLPPDFNETMKSIIKTLPYAQRKLISEYYMQNKSMNKISAEQNIARQTINVRLHKILNKLRQPQNAKRLKMGDMFLRKTKRYQMQNIQHEIQLLANKYNDAYNNALQDLESGKPFYNTTSITTIYMSTRTFRALIRNNINTLGDLQKYSMEEIASFKGVGKTCIQELQTICKRFDIKLKERI